MPRLGATSCDASSWAPAEKSSSPSNSHGAAVAAAPTHHQSADSTTASQWNPHSDPLPCENQSPHTVFSPNKSTISIMSVQGGVA